MIFFLRSGLTVTLPGAECLMRLDSLRLSASCTVRRILAACGQEGARGQGWREQGSAWAWRGDLRHQCSGALLAARTPPCVRLPPATNQHGAPAFPPSRLLPQPTLWIALGTLRWRTTFLTSGRCL